VNLESFGVLGLSEAGDVPLGPAQTLMASGY